MKVIPPAPVKLSGGIARMIETGWLLDDGRLCLGVACGKFALVCYTDSHAIRFARKEDAQLALAAIGNLNPLLARGMSPVHHQWGR